MSDDESVSLIAPNPAQPIKEFTVEDQLKTRGDTPERVINLGNAIQEITSCESAVAISPAKDNSSSQILVQGVEYLITVWYEITPVLEAGIIPWQSNTLRLMVDGICSNIKAY